MIISSAYKNKGVQPLLDGVIDYLPNPLEKYERENDDSWWRHHLFFFFYFRENFALDPKKNNEKVLLSPDPKKDLVA